MSDGGAKWLTALGAGSCCPSCPSPSPSVPLCGSGQVEAVLPAAGPFSLPCRPLWARSGGNYNSRRALHGPRVLAAAHAPLPRAAGPGAAGLARRPLRGRPCPVRWVLRERERGPGRPGRDSGGGSGCEGRARTACGGELSRSALLSRGRGASGDLSQRRHRIPRHS